MSDTQKLFRGFAKKSKREAKVYRSAPLPPSPSDSRPKFVDHIYLAEASVEMYRARKEEIMAQGKVWSQYVLKLILQDALIEKLNKETDG